MSNPRDVDELEIWEIAAILGVNDLPATDEDVPTRPGDGPNPDNVRRMMAEQAEREGVVAPSRAEVMDLIRHGSKPGLG